MPAAAFRLPDLLDLLLLVAPYPNNTDWGSDPNGCIAFYITVSIAIALSALTAKLAAKKGLQHDIITSVAKIEVTGLLIVHLEF